MAAQILRSLHPVDTEVVGGQTGVEAEMRGVVGTVDLVLVVEAEVIVQAAQM